MSAISAPSAYRLDRDSSMEHEASNAWGDTFGRLVTLTALFVAMTFLTYLASGLAGNVMLERERKAGADAEARLRAASRRADVVRQRLETITNVRQVEEWALEHGFASPEHLAALTVAEASPVRASARPFSGATESAVSSAPSETVALLHPSGEYDDGATFR